MRRRPSPYDHPGRVFIDVCIGLVIGAPIGLALVVSHLAWKLGAFG